METGPAYGLGGCVNALDVSEADTEHDVGNTAEGNYVGRFDWDTILDHISALDHEH